MPSFARLGIATVAHPCPDTSILSYQNSDVLAGALWGHRAVWRLPAGHTSSWSCQLQELPAGGRELAEGGTPPIMRVSCPVTIIIHAGWTAPFTCLHALIHFSSRRHTDTAHHGCHDLAQTALQCFTAGHSLGSLRAQQKRRHWTWPSAGIL